MTDDDRRMKSSRSSEEEGLVRALMRGQREERARGAEKSRILGLKWEISKKGEGRNIITRSRGERLRLRASKSKKEKRQWAPNQRPNFPLALQVRKGMPVLKKVPRGGQIAKRARNKGMIRTGEARALRG